MVYQEGSEIFNFLLRPIFFVKDLFLLNPTKFSCRCSNVFYILRLIYLAFLFLIMTVVTSCKFYIFAKNTQRDGFTLGQLMDLESSVWCLESLISFIYIIYWQYGNHITTIQNMLCNATGNRGLAENKRWLMIKIATICLFCLSFIIGGNAALMSNLFKLTSFQLDELKFDAVLFGKSELNCFVAIALFYNMLSWLLAIVIYTVICMFTVNEVKYMNSQISSEKELDTYQLKAYMEMHKKLVLVVNEISKIFGGYFLWTLLFQLPLIILLVFNAWTKPLGLLQWIITGQLICTGVMKLTALTLQPAKLNEEMSETGAIVSELVNSSKIDTNHEMYQTASWFIFRIQTNSTGLNVCGFFLVTKELMLTVVSLAVTYLTLLIQSYVPPSDKLIKVTNGTIANVLNSNC